MTVIHALASAIFSMYLTLGQYADYTFDLVVDRYNPSETYTIQVDWKFFDQYPGYNDYQLKLAIDKLRRADSNDKVCLYINSPGGYVATLQTLVAEMIKSEGVTVAVVDRVAYSAAGITTLVADYVQLKNYSRVMLHLARPKGSNQPLSVDAPSNQYLVMLMNLFGQYKLYPFEVTKIKSGKDTMVRVHSWPNNVKDMCP